MEQTEKVIRREEKAYITLIAIFVGGLVIAGVLASKIVNDDIVLNRKTRSSRQKP